MPKRKLDLYTLRWAARRLKFIQRQHDGDFAAGFFYGALELLAVAKLAERKPKKSKVK